MIGKMQSYDCLMGNTDFVTMGKKKKQNPGVLKYSALGENLSCSKGNRLADDCYWKDSLLFTDPKRRRHAVPWRRARNN